MRHSTYGGLSDKELRRFLDADDFDTEAILEAAERFRKQTNDEDEPEERHEFDIAVQCPECDHEWDEPVDFNDYR